MRNVHIRDARSRLADLVDAAIAGECVYIEKEPGLVVQLVPVEKPLRRPRFGSARGLVTVREDFDEPLADMAEYEAAETMRSTPTASGGSGSPSDVLYHASHACGEKKVPAGGRAMAEPLHRPLLAQPRDVFGRVAQLAQHLIGMLTQERRVPSVAGRRLGEM